MDRSRRPRTRDGRFFHREGGCRDPEKVPRREAPRTTSRFQPACPDDRGGGGEKFDGRGGELVAAPGGVQDDRGADPAATGSRQGVAGRGGGGEMPRGGGV